MIDDMASDFRDVAPDEILDNVFKLIGADWMLVTAGTGQSFNTMTASWGGMGVLWDRPVCFSVIRPTRYTYTFMERSDVYTLSFFSDDYRDALTLCGTKSGREMDKVSRSGLTPVIDGNLIYFAEARLVIACRKLYFQDIMPGNFCNPDLLRFYPDKDYHRLYVGEITTCLAR